MARPRSPAKRSSILDACAQALAEQGLGASTSGIARLAGVAEGTVFTYFDTKDALLNELYLALKASLRTELVDAFPNKGSTEAQIRHAWNRYLDWGLKNPAYRKALRQLEVSEVITLTSRAAGSKGFELVSEALRKEVGSSNLPTKSAYAFRGSLFVALAEVTMEFIATDPKRGVEYRKAGLSSLCAAIKSV